MDEAERAARCEALERMARRFTSVPRTRDPAEAPVELTNAYVALVVACGFARLGASDRVAWFVASGRAVLELVRDAAHGYLLDAFVARATGDRAALAELDARYRTLDRVAIYRVDRLREASVLLQPARNIDALGDFPMHRASAGRLLDPPASRAVTVTLASLADAESQVRTCRTTTGRLGLLDGFAIALADAPYAQAIEWTEALAAIAWPTLTDRFGATNSHYCLTPIAGADALVRGLVGSPPT